MGLACLKEPKYERWWWSVLGIAHAKVASRRKDLWWMGCQSTEKENRHWRLGCAER